MDVQIFQKLRDNVPEKARHSDNYIIIVLKNNHGQWAVICQRFITNQRLRLAQKCDMICVESQSKDIEA